MTVSLNLNMNNLFTTNYSRHEIAKWLVGLFTSLCFITLAVLLVLNFYIAPLLDGWELVIDYIMLGEDSFFNKTVQSEIDSFVDRSKAELVTTEWDKMSDSQVREKLQLMIDNGTQDIFDKLYSIILVMVAPILTIPLIIWVVIKITIKFTNKILSMTKLVGNKELLIYFRGRQIMGKRTDPNWKIQKKQWFGIKDKCCTDTNILESKNSIIDGQCVICKRCFTR